MNLTKRCNLGKMSNAQYLMTCCDGTQFFSSYCLEMRKVKAKEFYFVERSCLGCMVTKDIAQKFPAGEIIKQIAPIVEGRGGGRNDMAQAGGKSPEKLGDALDEALRIIEKMGLNG